MRRLHAPQGGDVSIFSIFKKNRRPLDVGETSGDRIGCYLFGVEMPDGSDRSYHSVAASRDELVQDCMEFFSNLAALKREMVQKSPVGSRHAQDLKVIENAIDNLPVFIDMYLKQGGDRPFFTFPGMRIFLELGERPRQKMRGQYIE